MKYTYLGKKIVRTGDLEPKGVRSTYGSRHSFNDTFEHIFKNIHERTNK